MKLAIKKITEWWIVDVSDGITHDSLIQLGWEWVDAYDQGNQHPFKYGYYKTNEPAVVKNTKEVYK